MPEDPQAGIDSDQPQRSMSTQAAMRAQDLDVVARYAWPTDTSDPRQMARLADVIGEDNLPPENSGLYYTVHVIDVDGVRRYVTLGEGTIVESLSVLALVTKGYAVAKELTANGWTIT